MIGAVLILFILIIPIALVALVISAIVRKNKETHDSESFEKVIRAIYTYIILICLILVMIVSVISIFNASMELLLPEESYTQKTEESITNDRNSNLTYLITAISAMAISLPVFVYYNKVAKNKI